MLPHDVAASVTWLLLLLLQTCCSRPKQGVPELSMHTSPQIFVLLKACMHLSKGLN